MRIALLALAVAIVGLVLIEGSVVAASDPECKAQQFATGDGSWQELRCLNVSCSSACNKQTTGNIVECKCPTSGGGTDCNGHYDWSQPGLTKFICTGTCPGEEDCDYGDWVLTEETAPNPPFDPVYKRECVCE